MKNWPFYTTIVFFLHLRQNHHECVNEFLKENLESIEQSNFKHNFEWLLKVIDALN